MQPTKFTRFARMQNVLNITGLGRTSVYRLMKEGKFPKQVELAPNTRAWILDEVEAWCAARIAESRNERKAA
jgi:prophage regulatory protein